MAKNSFFKCFNEPSVARPHRRQLLARNGKVRNILFSVLIFVSIQSSPSFSHDITGLIEEQSQLDEASQNRLHEAEQRRQALKRLLIENPSFQLLESVLRTSAAWPTGAMVIVCFLDGSREARARVASVAREWTDYGNVKLDFGGPGALRTCDSNTPSHIRVSFKGSGFWSYVGTDSKSIRSDEPTLNLSGLDQPNVDQAEFRRIVLHEFGHALGFEHEHQSPNTTCEEEFDWDYLYTHLPWSRETIDRNMKRLTASWQYAASAYDPLSIMHYTLPARYFLRGQNSSCFISPRSTLSDGDKSGIAKAYPARPLFLSEELEAWNRQLQGADVTDATRQAFTRALERADPRTAGQKLSEE